VLASLVSEVELVVGDLDFLPRGHLESGRDRRITLRCILGKQVVGIEDRWNWHSIVSICGL
jgi:hypothetical protein